ncbi:Proteasome component Ecm29 [Trinorchestia longiramus]|nr:Proteasome component Ecm29 [Trinorchestia longiramus]
MTFQHSDLSLVQRVFDRITAAGTDEELQTELDKYLAPVINKLNSNNDAVRNTIVEMLGHINRRIKDHQHIQLPVEALLGQFSAPGASAFVVNFSLVYIRMGFPRLDSNKQVELLPKLLESLDGKPPHQQDSVLVLLLPVLGHIKGSAHVLPDSPLMKLKEKPAIAKLLLDYMQDILLLPYGGDRVTIQQLLVRQEQRRLEEAEQQQEAAAAAAAEAASVPVEEGQQQQATESEGRAPAISLRSSQGPPNSESVPVAGVPAGMSMYSYTRAQGEVPFEPEQLEKLKLTVIKFLDAQILSPSSMALAVIIASSDTRCSVANAAESLLRRLDATIEWNSSAVISAMYVHFLGTLTPIQRGPIEKFKNPANTRIRLKLMPCFLKSREATNYAPLAVKVFCECLWGSHTNTRLKQLGITFLHHISSCATTEKIKPVGSMLFSGIVKVIDEEKSDAKLTSLAYGALAKLSLKLPNLLLSHESQLHYLQTLMDALTHEVGDVLLAIQEALSMVAPVCKHLSANSQEQLCILLSSHVQHNNPALRRTAVHYAASVFSRTHFASRFILLLATGDSQDDIRLEATRELYRNVKDDDNAEYVSPSFSSMVGYTIERMNDQPRSNWRDVANTPLPYSLKVMEELVMYLQHCLAIESKSNCSKGSSKPAVTLFREGNLMWPDCCAVGSFVAEELKRPRDGLNPYFQYLGLCEMVANAWSAVGVEAMVRLICVVPAILSPRYTEKIDWLRRFLIRGGHAGQIAALLFGAVTGQIEDQLEFERAVQSIRNIKELRQDSQQCCILATGHSLAFTQHRLKCNDDVVLEDEWTFFAQTLRQLVTDLVNSDGGVQSAYITAIADVARFTSLPVPVGNLSLLEESKPSVETTEVIKAVDSESSSSSSKLLSARPSSKKDGTLVELFCVIKAVYENNKLSSKVREQAIQCSGHLCVGQSDLPIKSAVIKSLLRFAHESDELEIHFSVGGALADCVLGPASSSALNLWTERDPNADSGDSDQEKNADPQKEKAERMDVDSESDASVVTASDEKPLEVGTLAWLLDQLLNHYVPMSKPSVRQASCIWLLTVLKRCRLCAEVQRSLPLIQSAFMNLLADNNELVQDAASKGLCVVYECCSEDTRRSMVEGLVHALTEGKSRVTNVTSNTKLFREGELGTAPSGGQLSTYRELCSLASDLNQPDLVYKFMNLANHNAIWNSRKGAAFGFGSLAQQAGTQLEPFLPAIVPKLFRYQHDPTPRIQQPMAHIWSCLVTDTNKTTEKYYSAIMEDLLSNLTSTLWRVRESCCGALADLIRQHSVVPAVPHLPAIWTTLFRVRDDIKESVRTAANKTLEGLSKSCIKVCESGGEDGQRVLESVLPVLLTDGITSSVAEVRSISLDAIVQVCRSGGAMIRLHLGTLVPALLEAIAGLEHKSVSYTAIRTTAEEDRDRFDSLRVAASRSTPMMDTLNYVLQFVDEEVMDAVVAGVMDVLKRSIGLTSRTAAAHVVETLTHTCPGPLEKHTGKILSVLVNGLNDRNATVRKVFANAIGTLIKIAKHSSVTKLLNKLESWYLDKEEDSVRYSCAVALRSMHRQSGDIMRDHASIALPLAYLAMHALKTAEDDPTGAEVWEEIWSDNTPGTEAGLKLYLSEILRVCEKAAVSSNWAMKAQSGKTIAALSSKVGSLLVQDQVQALVTLLLSCLQGRTWAGKENLLLALSTVAVEAKPVLSALKSAEGEEPLINDIVKLLLREANKEKKDYKVHAVRALTIVLQEYEVDKFDVVFDICSSFISQSIESNTSSSGVITEEERAAEQQEENVKWKLLEELVVSLGRAWPVAKCRDTQERYSVRVVELLSGNISKVPRTTQLSVVSSLGRYWERHYLLLHTVNTSHLVICSASQDGDKDTSERGSSPLFDPLLESQFDPALQHSCKIFNYCLGISKYYSLRKEALTVLQELLQRIKGNQLLVAKIARLVLAAVEEARRDAQPDIQDLAIALHKILVT